MNSSAVAGSPCAPCRFETMGYIVCRYESFVNGSDSGICAAGGRAGTDCARSSPPNLTSPSSSHSTHSFLWRDAHDHKRLHRSAKTRRAHRRIELVARIAPIAASLSSIPLAIRHQSFHTTGVGRRRSTTEPRSKARASRAHLLFRRLRQLNPTENGAFPDTQQVIGLSYGPAPVGITMTDFDQSPCRRRPLPRFECHEQISIPRRRLRRLPFGIHALRCNPFLRRVKCDLAASSAGAKGSPSKTVSPLGDGGAPFPSTGAKVEALVEEAAPSAERAPKTPSP